MLFSRLFEILLFILGLLYVLNQWFDSFINLYETIKNHEEEEEEKKIPESVKHLYN